MPEVNITPFIKFCIVGGLLALLGIALFPTVHLFVTNIDLSGFSDFNKLWVKLIPFGFVAVVVYGIYKAKYRTQ